GGVSGTLSATGAPTVNWDGASGGAAGAGFDIPNGSSSVTKNVQVTTVGTTVFDATATPAATAATTCNFGAPACTFTATDSAFIVTAPDHAAETASTLTIQAVKSVPGNPLLCTTGMTGAKTVNLKCSYANPASGTLPVRIGGTPLAADAVSACSAGGVDMALTFDASGVAAPTLQYADVGQMLISASFTGTPGSVDEGLVLTGGGNFIAAPASFSVTGVTAGPIKAGNPFSASVTALNLAGVATPNFGKETTAEGVTLSSVLAMGAGTWANPGLGGGAVIPGASFTNGVATANTLAWGEVGEINLQADLTSASYLGSTLTATGSTATSTQFIPDHYITEIISASGVPMTCPGGLTCPSNPTEASGMVYSGQPFSVKVTAQNLAGSTTTNYQGAYAQDVTLSGVGGVGTLSNPLLLAANFAAGAGTTTSLPAYTFTSAGPAAPADISLHAVGTGVSSAVVSSGAGESALKVAYGRIKIGNAYGSELLPLSMAAIVQYYDGTNWMTSSTDAAALLVGNASISNCQKNLGNPAPACKAVVAVGAASLNNGVGTIRMNATGTGNTGSADLTLNTAGWPAWLPSNTARATFGVYQGNNEFIYLREAH
ncbi:MAG: hypothetical protein Q8O64_20585, partial [Sideroxyarcus sp.]|nr:hypothetical protein [Sideroxyarcus sp.]